jgi:hypothetical protein
MASRMMAGLVTKMSSPTIGARSANAVVSRFQPSQACSASTSSTLHTGDSDTIAA